MIHTNWKLNVDPFFITNKIPVAYSEQGKS